MTFGNKIHMKKHIIPQHLSIKAFRDNGYKDAAHALAELIDNSIQAGDQTKETTEVEVLCLDREEFINSRTRNRLFEIAVLDNACGMNAETLEKALQFGNGTRLDDE
jgi:anti-sigma regulatory factor (Ser/Thr protein kinase)